MPLRYLETNKDEAKDWGIVYPVDDARLYTSIYGDQCGVVVGCECTLVGVNTIHISSGWGMIQGRRVELQEMDVQAKLGSSSDPETFMLYVLLRQADNTLVVDTYPGPETGWSVPDIGTVTEGTGQGMMPLATYTATNSQVASIKQADNYRIPSPSVQYYKTKVFPSATSGWQEITESIRTYLGLPEGHDFKYATSLYAADCTPCRQGLAKFDASYMQIVDFKFEPTENALTNTILQSSASVLAKALWKRLPNVDPTGFAVITDRLPSSDIALIIGVRCTK